MRNQNLSQVFPGKRFRDLSGARKTSIVVIILASAALGVFLALSAPRTRDLGLSILSVIAFPLAGLGSVAAAWLTFKARWPVIGWLWAIQALLCALFTLNAVLWLRQLL